MQLEYQLTIEDYREALNAYPKTEFHWTFAGLASLVIGIRLLRLATGTPLKMIAYGLGQDVVFLVILYVVGRLFLQVTNLRQWKTQPTLFQPQTIDASDDQLLIKTPYSESTNQWPLYTHFQETRNLFVIYQAKTVFSLVPKRSFGSSDQVSEFRQLLQQKIGRLG